MAPLSAGKVVALVPLRGGSKSIPLKNIKLLNGKPLCYYVLKAAADAPSIDEVYVSTDSPQIAQVVTSLGLGVKILHRPAELATDEASTEVVMLHAAREVAFDTLVTLQATSPLTRAADLEAALRRFVDNGHDSLLTAVRSKRFYWTPQGEALNYDPRTRPRRQEFEGTFVENGAFYITRRATLLDSRCRLGGSIGIHEMGEESFVEIDEPQDWEAVATLLRRADAPLEQRLGRVKAMVCDVDGTLTDGGMYFSAEGELAKKFNTRDGMGLNLLRERGVRVVVMTRENSAAVAARMKKLNITDYFAGVQEKLETLQQFCASTGLSMESVAFVGDDLNDLECLQHVGFAACPHDAVPEIRAVCDYCATARGGEGAVREIADLIRNCGHVAPRVS
jgi:N-acylneuraminate cytidylyltransferase